MTTLWIKYLIAPPVKHLVFVCTCTSIIYGCHKQTATTVDSVSVRTAQACASKRGCQFTQHHIIVAFLRGPPDSDSLIYTSLVVAHLQTSSCEGRLHLTILLDQWCIMVMAVCTCVYGGREEGGWHIHLSHFSLS